MHYPLYIILGILPSIVWLLFYLRKDAHPESNRMILKIFFLGMLATLPAAAIEFGFYEVIPQLLIYIFIGIALTEELLKYAVVNWQVLKDPEFDEPLDIMLYMIIAALGFAALENILYLFSVAQGEIAAALGVTALRFVGAVFLHALCSGTLGYFVALSFFEKKGKNKNFLVGLFTAFFLHGLFNYSIIKMEENFNFLFLILIILAGLAVFVSYGFKRLKGLKSVCQIK